MHEELQRISREVSSSLGLHIASGGADAGTEINPSTKLIATRRVAVWSMEGTLNSGPGQGCASEVEPSQLSVGGSLRVFASQGRAGLQSASYHMLNVRDLVRSKDGPRAATYRSFP